MANGYIFARDIQRALDQGQSQIELPEGSRLSPAARDLIRDYGVEVVYRPAEPAPPAAEAEPSEKPAAPAAEEKAPAAVELSQEDLERIAAQVLERLRARRAAPAEAAPEEEKEAEEGDDLIICRCEEITRGEIKEALRSGLRTLGGIRRVTRAGMGLCQGETCQRLVARIMAEELGLDIASVEPVTARAPTRPIPLGLMATG